MARDIEEFLRRAAQRRQEKKQGGGSSPPREKRRPSAERGPSREEIRRSPPLEEIEVEVVEERLVSRLQMQPDPFSQKSEEPSLRNESVREHVRHHIDTGGIARHAQSLGRGIASIHDRVESEVHRHLDHDISVVDDTPTITDDVRPGVVGREAPPIAKELLEMLSKPKTIRQAILINEILTRPNFDDD